MPNPGNPFAHGESPPGTDGAPPGKVAQPGPGVPEVPPRKPAWTDPRASSRLSPEYRSLLASLEADQRGYGTYRPKKYGESGIGAWGRYQFRAGALIDAGVIPFINFKTASEEEQEHARNYLERNFLNNPAKQEEALAKFTDRNLTALRTFRPRRRKDIGTQIRASDGTSFTITEAGLAAAAHYAGRAGVLKYLRHVAERGWTSDRDHISAADRGTFAEVERRLRLFEGVPLAADGKR